MKKFLLFVLLIMFGTTNANAITMTINETTSTPISRNYLRPVTTYSYYPRRYARPARPAQPRIARPARPAIPHRYRYAYYNYPPFITYYNTQEPEPKNVQPSRLNKNTRAVVPSKSYTMNGVTYYK